MGVEWSLKSQSLPERQIDSAASGRRVCPVNDGSDAVIGQPRRPAPDRYVAALHADATRLIAALHPPEQEHGRKAERDRNDRRPKVLLIFILVQGEFGARSIAVDQAHIRLETGESGGSGGALGEVQKFRGDRRPGLAGSDGA